MARLIQTAVRLTRKDKADVEALAAAYATTRQKIMEMAITRFIQENYADIEKGQKLIETGKRLQHGQAAEVPRKNPRG